MDFWQWLQQVMGKPKATPPSAYDPVQSGRGMAESVNPYIASGSISDAIQTVLSRNNLVAREISPNLSGGKNNPVSLPMVTVEGHRSSTGIADHLSQQYIKEVPQSLPTMYAAVPKEDPNPAKVWNETGILPQQAAWNPALSQVAFNSIQPAGYGLFNNSAGQMAQFPSERQNRLGLFLQSLSGQAVERESVSAFEEAAWRLYLGLPLSEERPALGQGNAFVAMEPGQNYDSLRERDLITPSKYRPSIGDEPGVEYYSVPQALINRRNLRDWIRAATSSNAPVVVDAGAYLPFQHFTLSVGADEQGPYVSYYDIYDLAVPGESRGMIGKPYRFYDRIRFDPSTLEPIIEPDPRLQYKW